MKNALWPVVGFLVGLLLAFALVIGVEAFSAVVHPFPAEFAGTTEEVCRHVAIYPQWVLAVVVLAWSAAAFISTYTATRIGKRVAGITLATLLLLGLGSNVAMLPYTTWFKIVMPLGAFGACFLGTRLGAPTSHSAA